MNRAKCKHRWPPSPLGPAAGALAVLLLCPAGCGGPSSSPARAPKPSEAPQPTTTREATGATKPAPEETGSPQVSAAVHAEQPPWLDLFDGKSLGNWAPTNFGGEGEVKVENGQLVLGAGNDMTGVTWKDEPPARINYEIELEAMRVDGRDFFCGLTFPVGEAYCSLILGGWGGGTTGLSSLEGADASENETSRFVKYTQGQWYRVRLRVTRTKTEAWLDDEQIVDLTTAGRQIGTRIEVEPSKPLGIATWRTTGALRKIRLRKLAD